MQEIPGRQIAIQDPYWSPRLDVNAREAIFHQWDQLETSRCIDNFRIAAGELDSFREGWFFSDSDAYKWLDAASRISVTHSSPELLKLIEDFIALLRRAQAPDGYLFTYNQIHFPNQRWVALQVEHELYCHGHLIEAGVSHFEATGKTDLLVAVRKAADLLVRDFLNEGPEKVCGHEEIEIALLRLYIVTRKEDYLELARQFIERRGRVPNFTVLMTREWQESKKRSAQVQEMRKEYLKLHPDHREFRLPPGNASKKPPNINQRWYLSALRGFYSQQHAPIRKQKIPVGHAVRFGYLQTAGAALHRLLPDPTLMSTLEASWERMVTRRMYVTGGLGSLPALEGFGRDYELDPEFAYAETCAAIASLFWNWEMALATGEARYSDLFEWQLFNAAAVGMGSKGKNYLYNNPLFCRGGVTRKPWYAVPCCPSNLSRTWASLGKYIFSLDQECLWIHQYMGCKAEFNVNGYMGLEMDSQIPWSGKVSIRVDLPEPRELNLHLRLPSWRGPGSKVFVNGEMVDLPGLSTSLTPTASGYDPRLAGFLELKRLWRSGDLVELDYVPNIELRCAHPKVKGHAGKSAITRGPLVYCLESVDNPGIDIFSTRIDPSSLSFEFDDHLLGGIGVIHARSISGERITAIPYYLWANRGESQMTVWINTVDETL